ncbi:MAG: UDP-glucose 4-epimerase GalE [Verrucomicrobia bacterium]|nr:UDP-glucose 4-epimerase GalE [Verrucomicrobiota bacterium]MBV8483576.1 UDP-glucose 4-epimerase GalE [Verrucomicrobiota bacterium]
MKILVTGGAGYIGSVCVEDLLNRGHNVTVFDNLTEGHKNAIDRRANFVQGDLADKPALSDLMRTAQPEAVMHFAANALVGESMQNPYKYFYNNVSCGLNLLHAMVEHGVKRFVFSSTCATYGIPETVPIDELAPQKPVNPYGESKLIFEKILRWFDEIHGVTFASLRYFNAAGATEAFGEDHRIETHLIPCVLQVPLGKREHAQVFGTDYPTPDGSCIRDYIHVTDLAQAHALALEVKKSDFFNLGIGGGVSVLEVIGACTKVTGKDIPVVKQTRRAGDPPRLIASAGKAQEVLGWRPQFDRIEDIVSSAWSWHLRHPAGYGD